MLARHMPPDDALEAIHGLEARLNRALGGLPVTADVLTQAIELASAIIRPPDEYRWEADVQEGGRLSLYIVALG